MTDGQNVPDCIIGVRCRVPVLIDDTHEPPQVVVDVVNPWLLRPRRLREASEEQ